MSRRNRWLGQIRPEWDWTKIWNGIALAALVVALAIGRAQNVQRPEHICHRMYARARTAADSALVDAHPAGRDDDPGWTCGRLPRTSASLPTP
ncbi:hypothetical protein SAMN05216486_1135 [bacterium JGI 053]|nr:hypothetical protein SAMN05216486_1135 [bacterium JGI 053]